MIMKISWLGFAVVNMMNMNAVGECSDGIMRRYYILISKRAERDCDNGPRQGWNLGQNKRLLFITHFETKTDAKPFHFGQHENVK